LAAAAVSESAAIACGHHIDIKEDACIAHAVEQKVFSSISEPLVMAGVELSPG
jgi:hypothetical protein